MADASLHRDWAEHGIDGRPQRLAAVEDDEHALVEIQAAVDELGQQVPGHGGVLGAAVPAPERDLHALRVDAQGNDAAAALQLDPVEHQRCQPHVAEITAHERAQVLGRPADELARHRRLRGRALGVDDVLADRFACTREPTRRDAGQHLLDHHPRERVAIGEVPVGLKADLAAAVGGAHPRPLDGDAAPTERDLASLAAVTHRAAIGIATALGPDDLSDFLFHQRVEHPEPDADRQGQQPVLGGTDQLAQRLLDGRRQRELAAVRVLLYGPQEVLLLRRG